MVAAPALSRLLRGRFHAGSWMGVSANSQYLHTVQ